MVERSLATIPAGCCLRDAWFGSRLDTVTYILSQDNSYFVMHNDSRGSPFDSIMELVCDQAGLHCGYVGTKERRAYVLDATGRPQGPYEWAGYLALDLDGRLAYVAIKNGRWYLFENQAALGPFDEVMPCESSGARGRLFAARIGNAWRVFLRDEPGDMYDEIMAIEQHAADEYSFWGKRDGTWILYLNGDQVSQPVEDVCGGPAISGRGELAYWSCRNGVWSVVAGTRVGAGFDRYVHRRPIYRPNHDLVSYAGVLADTVRLVLDERVDREFDAVGALTFSATGERHAYLVRQGLREFAVVDGRADRPFDVMWPDDGEYARDLGQAVVFSRSGRRTAYVGRRGERQHVVVDGNWGPAFDHVMEAPSFAGVDEDAVYPAALRGALYVVRNERMKGPYERVWLIREAEVGRSSESGQVHYGVLKRDKLEIQAID